MTDPAAFTDSRWAAQEARRIALEQAELICLRKRDAIQRVFGAYHKATMAAEDCANAIRALIEAGK